MSVDRFREGDDEVDVDVEQCSDSEAPSRSRTPRSASNNSRATPQSDEERLSPEPVRKKVSNHQRQSKMVIFNNENFALSLFPMSLLQSRQITGSCNSDDLRPIQCHLETKELWDKFHDLGTGDLSPISARKITNIHIFQTEMIITKTGR